MRAVLPIEVLEIYDQVGPSGPASTGRPPTALPTAACDPCEVDRRHELGYRACTVEPVEPGSLAEPIFRLGCFLEVPCVPTEARNAA